MSDPMLRARGLHTNPNFFSEVPEGSLVEAKNVVIDRDGIIEPRRGIKLYGNNLPTTNDRVKQKFFYKGRLLRHFLSNTDSKYYLQYDNGSGTFTTFSGNYDQITNSNMRIKSVEANGNLYFTSNTGIKKISATTASEFTDAAGYITDAGGVKALEVIAKVNYESTGVLEAEQHCAYRIVWGITDVNGNLVLGSPSYSITVDNLDSVNGCVVDLEFPIPTVIGTNTNYFYQVYRTACVDLSIDVGDECYLVIEDFPTSAQLSSKIVTLTDFTPESFRSSGALLYTNPTSGSGITQANEPPPFAKDITTFNGYTFYLNTRTRQRKQINLLSVDDMYSNTVTDIVNIGGTPSTTIQITCATHGLTDGTKVLLAGTGNAALDDKEYTVANKTTDTFEITVTSGTYTYSYARIYTSYIKITDGTTSNTYYFVGEKETYEMDFSVSGSVTSADLAGKYATLASANDERKYMVWWDEDDSSTQPSLSGYIPIEVDIFNTDTVGSITSKTRSAILSLTNDFNITNSDDKLTISCANYGNVNTVVSDSVSSGNFSLVQDGRGDGESASKRHIFLPRIPSGTENGPTVSQQIDSAARSIIRCVNSNNSELVYAYYLSGYDDVPGQILFEQRSISGNAFYFNVNNVTVGAEFNPTLPISGSTVISDNETKPNRLYWSKYQQPEAVPIVNYIDVGAKDKEIQRGIGLRDGLIIFKEDGVFRLSGNSEPFAVNGFDTVVLMSKDSATILNNQIYALSTQGVIKVDDSSVSVLSRPIENLITEVTRTGYSFASASFGVGYEMDRAYLLWTVSDSSDTYATQCFRYNIFTQTWTRWDVSASCGIIDPVSNKLYIGETDVAYSGVERKELDRGDFCDREYSKSILNDGVDDVTIKVNSLVNFAEGDRIYQIQYLTIDQFNRTLTQLDTDYTLSDTDYLSSLEIEAGANLRTAVTALATKLSADDTSVDYTALMTAATDFETIQEEYNDMIDALNSSSGVFFSNYSTSEGTIPREAIIVDTESSTTSIITNGYRPFLAGPITLYKAIPTEIIWSPQFGGNPSLLKQYSEGTIMFENFNFSKAALSFASDLSPSYEEIEFDALGSGAFGSFNWSEHYWGGISGGLPLRTFIPRQKQRCRYIICRFTHNTAYEGYSILGISLVSRAYSTKAYK